MQTFSTWGYEQVGMRRILKLLSQNLSLSLSQQTPMHTAAKDGNEYTMKGLVNLGADINIKDINGVRDTIILNLSIPFPRKTCFALFISKQPLNKYRYSYIDLR